MRPVVNNIIAGSSRFLIDLTVTILPYLLKIVKGSNYFLSYVKKLPLSNGRGGRGVRAYYNYYSD